MRSYSDVYLSRRLWAWHQARENHAKLCGQVAEALKYRQVIYKVDHAGLLTPYDVPSLTSAEQSILEASAARVGQARHAYETAKHDLRNNLTNERP